MTIYGVVPYSATTFRDFETGLSPERLELLADQAYARAHSSPFCGCECPPKAICRNEPACDEQRKDSKGSAIYAVEPKCCPADGQRKHGHMPDITLPPAIQARAAAGRWEGAHSRHPFGAN